MANFEIPENPEYIEEIRKFETTDPAHAELFNNVIKSLINNETFLKKVAEQQLRMINQNNLEITEHVENGDVHTSRAINIYIPPLIRLL